MNRRWPLLILVLTLSACEPTSTPPAAQTDSLPLPTLEPLDLPEPALPEPRLSLPPLSGLIQPRPLDLSLPDVLQDNAPLSVPPTLSVDNLFAPRKRPSVSLSVEPLLKDEETEEGETRTVLDGALFNLERPWP